MTESEEHRFSKRHNAEILEALGYESQVEKRIGTDNKVYWVDVYGKHPKTNEEIVMEIGSVSSDKRVKFLRKNFDKFINLPLFGKDKIRYRELKNEKITMKQKQKVEG